MSESSDEMIVEIVDGMMAKFRERIVRCRDCKYGREEGVETECWFCVNDRWNMLPTMGVPVQPDDFCAWAESVSE